MSPTIQAIIAGVLKHLALSMYPINTNKVLIQPNVSIIILNLLIQFQILGSTYNLYHLE